ncbi:MAG: ABC transporter permease [Gemmatimonadetes bacterium]|nr:ABC transporter permease [Gemmatimonadota bacterium]
MRPLSDAVVIAAKDLRIEFRTGGRLVAMAAFVVLAAFLFSFAFDRALVDGRSLGAALVWLTVVFASTVGVGRTFHLEDEDGAFRHLLLTPASRGSVFLGKGLANLILVWLTSALVFITIVVFFGIRGPGPLLSHAAVLLPGTVGLVSLLTLFSRVSSHSRLGDTLLPVLTFPLLLPVVFFGSTASARLFLGRPWAEVSGPVRILWAFALVSLVVSGLLFTQVAED